MATCRVMHRRFYPFPQLSALFTVLLLLASCADIGEPELGADPGLAVTTAPGEGPDEDDEQPDGAEVAPSIRDFAPPRPEGYVPSVVVGASSGVLVYDEESGIVRLADPVGSIAVNKLVDDYFGGLVIQQGANQIQWLDAQGDEAIILDDAGGVLLDVGFLDATGAVHALIAVDGTSVDTVSLSPNLERAEFLTLDEGQALLDLAASNGLHAVVIADESCGDLVFFNSTGSKVDLGGPGRPACVVARRPAYGAVALSPDRSKVIYTELTYRSDGVVAMTRIIARDLASEAELFNLQVGEAGEQISNLSFDGQRLAYIRKGPDGARVEILDPSSGEPASVLDVRSPLALTFARQRLVVGRDSLDQ